MQGIEKNQTAGLRRTVTLWTITEDHIIISISLNNSFISQLQHQSAVNCSSIYLIQRRPSTSQSHNLNHCLQQRLVR